MFVFIVFLCVDVDVICFVDIVDVVFKLCCVICVFLLMFVLCDMFEVIFEVVSCVLLGINI